MVADRPEGRCIMTRKHRSFRNSVLHACFLSRETLRGVAERVGFEPTVRY